MIEIVGVVVVHEELAEPVEALHQHALPVHVGEALGAVDGHAAQLPGVVGEGRVEGVRDLGVVDEVEEGEAEVVHVVLLVGPFIQDAGHPAHDLPVPKGEEAPGLAVLEGRVLVGHQVVDLIPHHVGHVVGIVFIELGGKEDEVPDLAPGFRYLDVDHGSPQLSHFRALPPIRCRCRWWTLWPASSPTLVMSR